jgi:hypothetical protein
MKKITLSFLAVFAISVLSLSQNIINPLEGLVTFYPIQYLNDVEIFIKAETQEELSISYRSRNAPMSSTLLLNERGSFNVQKDAQDIEIYISANGKLLNDTPIIIPTTFDNSIEVSKSFGKALELYVEVEDQKIPINEYLKQLISSNKIHVKEAISYAQQFFYNAVGEIPRGGNELDYIFNRFKNSDKSNNSCWCNFILSHTRLVTPFDGLLAPENNIPVYTEQHSVDIGGLYERRVDWIKHSRGPAINARLRMKGTHQSHQYERGQLSNTTAGTENIAQITYHFQCSDSYLFPAKCECTKNLKTHFRYSVRHQIINFRPGWFVWSRGQNMGIEDFAIVLVQNGSNGPLQVLAANRMKSFSANNHNWNPQFFSNLVNLAGTAILTYLQINDLDSTGNVSSVVSGNYSQLTQQIAALINTPIFTSEGSTSNASNHTLDDNYVLFNGFQDLILEPNKPLRLFLSGMNYMSGSGYGKWDIRGESWSAFGLSAIVMNNANISSQINVPNACCSDKVGVFIVGALDELQYQNIFSRNQMRAHASVLFSNNQPWPSLTMQGNGLYALPNQDMGHIIYTPLLGCAETVPNIAPPDVLIQNETKSVSTDGENGFEEPIEIGLYPNPMHASLFVTFSREFNLNVLVIDAMGRIVPSDLKTVNDNTHEVIFNKDVAPGTYFVRVFDGKTLISTHKIIKL